MTLEVHTEQDFEVLVSGSQDSTCINSSELFYGTKDKPSKMPYNQCKKNCGGNIGLKYAK
jgi:hypothetical protein